MEYMIKLVIGEPSSLTFEKTGVEQIYFHVVAMIDLRKCSSDSNVSKVEFRNKDESREWFYYMGDNRVLEDCYGDKSKPIDINIVINALEIDVKNYSYPQLKWGLEMLKAIKNNNGEDMKVMFYGH